MEDNLIRVKLDTRCENCILSKDLYKERTIKLVGEGIVLTEAMILRLTNHGIRFVYVYRDEYESKNKDE